MAWLVRDGEVLATVELAESMGARLRGLLGRDTIDGAILLRPAKSVHTIAMKFPIDVAFIDDDQVVVRTLRMKQWRVTRPMMKARAAIEAEAGAFAQWDLKVGDHLEIKG